MTTEVLLRQQTREARGREIRLIGVIVIGQGINSAGVEPQAPFGGMKASSSYSREQGLAARDFYTQTKTISVDRAG